MKIAMPVETAFRCESFSQSYCYTILCTINMCRNVFHTLFMFLICYMLLITRGGSDSAPYIFSMVVHFNKTSWSASQVFLLILKTLLLSLRMVSWIRRLRHRIETSRSERGFKKEMLKNGVLRKLRC